MVTEKECLFCRIIKGEIPSKKIYEDKNIFAFLDINPAAKGHTLVVPKKHSLDIFDTNDADLSNTIVVIKKLATIIKEKLNTNGINIIQNNGKRAGQLVEHMHFHIIPRYADDKIGFIFPRAPAKPEDLDAIQKKISTPFLESVEKDFSEDELF